jgi:hypothetical protein
MRAKPDLRWLRPVRGGCGETILSLRTVDIGFWSCEDRKVYIYALRSTGDRGPLYATTVRRRFGTVRCLAAVGSWVSAANV